MPTWEGIEDVGSAPTRVWLSRKSVDDVWKPLRKADCRALNNSDGTVYIDGGRATADPQRGFIWENFCPNAPPTLLTSATWFTKEEVSKQIILKPIDDLDSSIIEDLYQRAVTATSSLGSGIDGVLQEKYVLPGDSEYNVMVVKVGNTLQMKKRAAKGWFGKEWDLQRGWGEYIVDGEEEEEMLGDVQHLIFCVHGIGEAMWSRDVMVYSLQEEVNRARCNLQKMQVAEWKKQCEQARSEGQEDVKTCVKQLLVRNLLQNV